MNEGDIGSLVDRIEASQSQVNAFVQIAGKIALTEQASRLADIAPGPLRGCPVAVKDLIDTEDFPTAYGSELYSGHKPSRDAAVVALLRRAGALIVGKTATSEFATWLPTKVSNPRAPGHTPGGSSAGSAAAVAAGLVPLALGTQTLGSVIRPASYCGIVGFKPSFGRLPVAGIRPLAESLDTVGLLGRSVAAVAAGYAVLAQDTLARPKRHELRFGMVRKFDWTAPDTDAEAAFAAAVEYLRGAGLAISELATGDILAPLDAAVQLVHRFEMGRSLLADLARSKAILDEGLAEVIEAGAALSADTHGNALTLLEAGRNDVAALMDNCDVILCLSATGEAPRGKTTTGDPALNRIWTGLHMPCATIPVLRSARGLPIGLQIIAPKFADRLTLQAAHALEHLFRRYPKIA